MTFDFYRFRFLFSALDPIVFPPGQPGNILRGAFGKAFRGIVCLPECPGARGCPKIQICEYARIFDPYSAEGPSGFAERPRPFVFRAAGLDGKSVQTGERFWFDVHLFDTREPPRDSFTQAFEQLAKNGLGPQRGRADLTAVEQNLISINFAANPVTVQNLRVEFVSPTELKSRDTLVTRPDFEVLFARARDRVSALRAMYGAGPLDIDFRAMGERAAAVRLTACELRQVGARRRSSRNGQMHGIGGFVGAAEYAGELGEFLPYLDAAQWTGVGRQCVWGKGELRLKF